MMNNYLTTFLIGFSTMMAAHYLLEATWGVHEPRPRSWRLIFNYSIGVTGIGLAFLYLHPDLWLDLLVSVAGAAAGTVISHSGDYFTHLVKKDKADGLIQERKKEA